MISQLKFLQKAKLSYINKNILGIEQFFNNYLVHELLILENRSTY